MRLRLNATTYASGGGTKNVSARREEAASGGKTTRAHLDNVVELLEVINAVLDEGRESNRGEVANGTTAGRAVSETERAGEYERSRGRTIRRVPSTQ
jgi:hypothetical protein